MLITEGKGVGVHRRGRFVLMGPNSSFSSINRLQVHCLVKINFNKCARSSKNFNKNSFTITKFFKILFQGKRITQ